jgi:ATP-binding cassette subfamily B protein
VWLAPSAGVAALVAVAVGAAVFVVGRPFLDATGMRMQSHRAIANRPIRDALYGPVPIRAHRAEETERRVQEDALVTYADGAEAHETVTLVLGGLVEAVGLAVVIFAGARLGLGPRALIGVYWASLLGWRLPQVIARAREASELRYAVGFILEPLGQLDGDDADAEVGEATLERAPAIRLDDVTLAVGGLTILDHVSLEIPAGAKVALVGRSGAGKTSLVGLILGWHRATGGRLLIDEKPADPALDAAVRRAAVWVDPAVHVFNRGLEANIAYGVTEAAARPSAEVLDDALLADLVARLPADATLGESGRLLSGGESQRVRFARAMKKRDPKLVVLDEPFRGLERERRLKLLERAKKLWKDATFLCAVHDMEIAAAFDRVILIEDGKVIEDGAPAELAARPGSRFAARLEAERKTRAELLAGTTWRRLVVDGGRVRWAPAEGQGSERSEL